MNLREIDLLNYGDFSLGNECCFIIFAKQFDLDEADGYDPDDIDFDEKDILEKTKDAIEFIKSKTDNLHLGMTIPSDIVSEVLSYINTGIEFEPTANFANVFLKYILLRDALGILGYPVQGQLYAGDCTAENYSLDIYRDEKYLELYIPSKNELKEHFSIKFRNEIRTINHYKNMYETSDLSNASDEETEKKLHIIDTFESVQRQWQKGINRITDISEDEILKSIQEARDYRLKEIYGS